jgi:hypothetical protein
MVKEIYCIRYNKHYLALFVRYCSYGAKFCLQQTSSMVFGVIKSKETLCFSTPDSEYWLSCLPDARTWLAVWLAIPGLLVAGYTWLAC